MIEKLTKLVEIRIKDIERDLKLFGYDLTEVSYSGGEVNTIITLPSDKVTIEPKIEKPEQPSMSITEIKKRLAEKKQRRIKPTRVSGGIKNGN